MRSLLLAATGLALILPAGAQQPDFLIQACEVVVLSKTPKGVSVEESERVSHRVVRVHLEASDGFDQMIDCTFRAADEAVPELAQLTAYLGDATVVYEVDDIAEANKTIWRHFHPN